LLHRLVARSYVPARFRALREVLRRQQDCEALLQRLRASGPLPNEVKRNHLRRRFRGFHPCQVSRAPCPLPGAMVFRFDEEGRVCAHWKRAPTAWPHRPEISMNGFTAAPPRARRPAPDAGDPRFVGSSRRARSRKCWTSCGAKGDSFAGSQKYYAESYVQHNPDMPGGPSHEFKEVTRQRYFAGHIQARPALPFSHRNTSPRSRG